MGYFENKQMVYGVTSTATAAGTTTLTSTSTTVQIFTGSSTQTVKLPSTSGMVVGQNFIIVNSSTGALTIQYQDGTSFTPQSTVAANTSLTVVLNSTGTTNGSWSLQAGSSGSTPTYTAPNAVTFSGTWGFYVFTVPSGTTFSAGAIYTTGGISVTVKYSSTLTGTTMVTYNPSGPGASLSSSGTLTLSSGTGQSSISYSAFNTTGLYYPSSPNILYLKLTVVGGGGGGGGSGTGGAGTGGTGGTTTFGSTPYITCTGGSGGATNGDPGGGGGSSTEASSAYQPIYVPTQSAYGCVPTASANTSTAYSNGGNGGATPLGGAGWGSGATSGGAGGSAMPGSGSGGGGAGIATNGVFAGAGGGAGGYIEVIVPFASAGFTTSAPFSIGAGGGYGTAGGSGSQGGTGGSGCIVIEEHFQ